MKKIIDEDLLLIELIKNNIEKFVNERIAIQEKIIDEIEKLKAIWEKREKIQ